MMELTKIFALFQEGSQATQGWMSSVSDWCHQLGLGGGELGIGGVAVTLALVWCFVRIVRMVVGILLGLCILLLVLQLAGVVNAGAVWETCSTWLFPGEQ